MLMALARKRVGTTISGPIDCRTSRGRDPSACTDEDAAAYFCEAPFDDLAVPLRNDLDVDPAEYFLRLGVSGARRIKSGGRSCMIASIENIPVTRSRS